MRDTETTVIEMIRARQQLGLNKYGTTVARNPLELRQWLQHSLEEKLDDCIYVMRAIQELDSILQAQSLPVDLFSPDYYESSRTKTR
jgi:hypothetical protein